MISPLYPVQDSRRINRRTFMLSSSSLAAAAFFSSCAWRTVKRNPAFSDYPFQLGVASGDPTDTGVVLWTRLAPKPLEGGGMPDSAVEVFWQVAEDEQMTRVVRKGRSIATPEWAHSVHVEVDGLQPGRWYWYQFKAGGEVSSKGRTRTMPQIHEFPDRLRFAFASCQHYETGYFTAYEHLIKDDNDLIVHLGDYIYEGAGRDKQVRKHVGPELHTISDYRNRYAQYRCDNALKNAHASAPWIVTWDDHEFDNNCAGAISEEAAVTPEQFLKRRAQAYQAYYEHMPLRRSSIPRGPDMKIYRRISFGRLAEFYVLDTRQYRTNQPCGDGNKPQCAEAFSPSGTLLGGRQRKWLLDGLASSPAQWNVLAQQVMMARVDRTAGDAIAYSMDQWPGYEVERRELLKFFHDRKISNPVVIAGDIHSHWANDLIADFENLDSKTVATEFVGTSVSSGGDGNAAPKDLDRLLSENPFVKYHSQQRGYIRCEISREQWRSDYQVLEFVTKPGAPAAIGKSFTIENGRPGLQT